MHIAHISLFDMLQPKPKVKELEEAVHQAEKADVKESTVTNIEPEPLAEEEPEQGSAKIEEPRRGKESLMEWIDRQLEEAERKTSGAPWPEIPLEDGLEMAAGEGASDVADMCASRQGTRNEQHGEIESSSSKREVTQAAATSLTDNPKSSPSRDSNQKDMKEILGRYLEPLGTSKNINDGSSLGAHGPGGSPLYAVSNVQYDMSSDSEIELLRDPAHEDLVGTGQLLDETDSEGEIGEELTLDVSSNQN